ncbi:class I SAM-dependent methyltransferase [Alkalicoccobacillus murimartini]|uniref:Site-specific DNA-methyltransferase (Adenine-specific) n=1 Tax=Alkalicoccobacillus murimartini TaxID=171685 RepID=A0ABT9YJT8_9BACI|nr:class I SAM-dependent methyltransferase [Alkalicoccobacillus murimartini]MDQ0208120.1 site-specific DNA-methyltransferase (adenine-specific) [Alkalicoccobacillus murimartini]
MSITTFNELYRCIDEGAMYLEKQKGLTYLEAIAVVGEVIFQETDQSTNADETTQHLNELMKEINVDSLERETVRKAFQMSVLKGMKGAVQSNHSMTPDAVSLFASYLINKITSDKKSPIRVLDLAVGTGNLLTTVMNHSPLKVEASGFEVDETLLQIAFANANLQKHTIELFHQDSLQISLKPSDIVVTDLPIGYYPKDDVAANYSLYSGEGHAYIHHLMIEQGIQSTDSGGYTLFLVPNFLFESDQAAELHTYLKEKTTILALLQLPKTMFKEQQHGKSFLLLQKKGAKTKVPRHALLADLPSFDKKEALADMMKQINKWFAEELNL